MDEIDKSDMLKVIEEFPTQCKDALDLGIGIKVEHIDALKNIIICGMGGSAVAGDLLKAYSRFKTGLKTPSVVPIIVKRGYDLPQAASKNSLIFIISYSGNTEETISCYKKAFALNAKIIIISSNGQLEQFAEKNNFPHVKVPEGLQPRMAIGYLFFPLLNIITSAGIIDSNISEIRKTTTAINAEPFKEEAKKLAKRMVGKIPLVYSSDSFSFMARYWKNSINENSKVHAFWNYFAELDHNELVGYTNMQAKFFTIILQDDSDTTKMQQRMKLTKKLIEEKGGECSMIKITGRSFIAKMLSGIMLGMLVSYYLALEYGTDPTPVKIIEELKRQLK